MSAIDAALRRMFACCLLTQESCFSVRTMVGSTPLRWPRSPSTYKMRATACLSRSRSNERVKPDRQGRRRQLDSWRRLLCARTAERHSAAGAAEWLGAGGYAGRGGSEREMPGVRGTPGHAASRRRSLVRVVALVQVVAEDLGTRGV